MGNSGSAEQGVPTVQGVACREWRRVKGGPRVKKCWMQAWKLNRFDQYASFSEVVLPGKEGGGPEGGEDFLGRGSERRGSGPE